MVRIAACDDNEFQRELMRDLLGDFAENDGREMHIALFSNGTELLEAVRKTGAFDVYILDMIMPELNGMEIAATLRLMKDPGKIIFLTSTLEYAAASYDVKAFYYMLKPVDPLRLFKVLESALGGSLSAQDSILVRGAKRETRLKPEDIMYVEMADRIPFYYLRDGRTLEGKTLRCSFRKTVEPLLEKRNFALCGVSLLVNLKYVDTIDSSSIMLKDGTQVFPPHSAYTELCRTWQDYRNRLIG